MFMFFLFCNKEWLQWLQWLQIMRKKKVQSGSDAIRLKIPPMPLYPMLDGISPPPWIFPVEQNFFH